MAQAMISDRDPKRKAKDDAAAPDPPKAPYFPDGRVMKFETHEFSHRPQYPIYVAGMIYTRDISAEETPIFVELLPEHRSTSEIVKHLPPDYYHLTNETIYLLVSSTFPVRQRNNRWPKVFNSNGSILRTRPNAGPAATYKHEGTPHNIIFKSFYTLHGDEGASKGEGRNWLTGLQPDTDKDVCKLAEKVSTSTANIAETREKLISYIPIEEHVDDEVVKVEDDDKDKDDLKELLTSIITVKRPRRDGKLSYYLK